MSSRFDEVAEGLVFFLGIVCLLVVLFFAIVTTGYISYAIFAPKFQAIELSMQKGVMISDDEIEVIDLMLAHEMNDNDSALPIVCSKIRNLDSFKTERVLAWKKRYC